MAVESRTRRRDAMLCHTKVSDELTHYGWKVRWAKVIEDHRASIVERLARKS